MHARPLPLLAATLCLAAGNAAADPAPTLDFATARHFTSNALDSPVRLAEWYSSLRGTIALPLEHAHGRTTLTLSAEGRHHDRVRIRNSGSASATLQTALVPSERLELRGTISLSGASEPDHLEIADLVVGMRTPRRAANAGIEAGFRLAPDLVLLAELSGTAETFGATRFEDDLLVPARLEPDRRRLRAALGVQKSFGPFAAGLSASAEDAAVELLGDPPIRLSSRTISLETIARWSADGRSAEFAAGAQHLVDEAGLFAEWRPALRAALTLPVGALELGGRFRLGYETVETDDPLGSYVMRGEATAALPLTPRLVLGAGLFVERRENLLLENEERRHGLHGELTFRASDLSDLVLRLDYARSDTTILDIRKDRLDLLVGLRTRI